VIAEVTERLDRAAHLRRDTDRLMAALDSPKTLFVPVYRDQNFVATGAEVRAVLVPGDRAATLIDAASEIVWLGIVGDKNCFALDLSNLPEPLEHPTLAGLAALADLRFVGGLLPALEADVLVYARGMLNWHRRHHFCSSCGQPTKPREGGHVRFCEAEDYKHFPRTDPAVMVIVCRGDKCVLARQPGWPKGFYAVNAGFIEPGESVEDAAIREVKEELGLDVGDLRYFRSQPWPFPSSLMLGFRAEAASDEIHVDREELEDARWFSRDEVRNPVGFATPPPYSLAHHLIRAFLEEK